MNIAEGESIQDGIPTPNNPVEIVNIFEVNDIQYQDNIPQNYSIGITKEQYCEYKQLQQERDKYKSIVEELKEDITNVLDVIHKNKVKVTSDESLAISSLEFKIKELEEGE